MSAELVRNCRAILEEWGVTEEVLRRLSELVGVPKERLQAELCDLVEKADEILVYEEPVKICEDCYEYVELKYGRGEIVKETREVCQDGPWTFKQLCRCIRILYGLALHEKEPDRVYPGWLQIYVVVPKVSE